MSDTIIVARKPCGCIRAMSAESPENDNGFIKRYQSIGCRVEVIHREKWLKEMEVKCAHGDLETQLAQLLAGPMPVKP
jgi:hypothetical protein